MVCHLTRLLPSGYLFDRGWRQRQSSTGPMQARGPGFPPPGPGSGGHRHGAGVRGSPRIIPVQIRNRTGNLSQTQPAAMPTWPVPEGRKTITVELPADHVDHLDRQAVYEGCSRAAYIRQLVRRDIERQGPASRMTASAQA